MLTTYFLLLLLCADVIRLWRRAVAYPQLGPSGPMTHPPALLHEYHIVAAPGVEVPEEVFWQAAQWADDEGVLVADLIPEGWAAPEALGLLQITHPIDYAQHPFASGVTGGVAVLVHESILAKRPPPDPELGLLEWIHYAKSLKRFAPWESVLVVATGWDHPAPQAESPSAQRAVLRTLYGSGIDHLKWMSPLVWGLMIYCAYSDYLWGGIVIALWMSQPALILNKRPLRSRWRTYALTRPAQDLRAWLKLWGPVDPDPHAPLDPNTLEPVYRSLMEGGLERFFDAPRTECPLCQSSTLSKHLTVSDFYQGKPGTFSLTRCEACDHIFQNPRLTLDGLEFYYKDFYDGLGESGMDTIFGASETSYRQRVSMIRAHGAPDRWLDVGGGHGHFTLIAKHLLPQTTFDLLDLSESVNIAAERGWCATGIQGFFPERAPTLKDRYGGVSMSHYLEHTLDPNLEISSAALMLDEGGLLMIEVPDPESKIGHVLKSFWLPWFQPQHLHFMSVKNITKTLENNHFDVVSLDRGEAHQSVDLFFAMLILTQRLAPDTSKPWRETNTLAQMWRGVVILATLPLILLAALTDRALRPLLARDGWSNTYRILAKKRAL
jgi:hypothetical protein